MTNPPFRYPPFPPAAAAMAGPLTLDPQTLHIDCAGTTATITTATPKVLGAAGIRAHIGSCLLPRRGHGDQGQGCWRLATVHQAGVVWWEGAREVERSGMGGRGGGGREEGCVGEGGTSGGEGRGVGWVWRVREDAHKHPPLGSPERFWGSHPLPSKPRYGHPKLMLCCVSEGGPTLYPQLRIDHGGGDRPDKRPCARGWRFLSCLPLDRLRGGALQLWRFSTLKRAICTSFFLAAPPADAPRPRRLVDSHWKVRVCWEWKDYGRLWRRTFRWVAKEEWRKLHSCQRKQDGELREQDAIQTGNSVSDQ